MPHPRFKDENYENFGGVNIKASAYLTGPREVISLFNYDFSVMGAWTKRPGSTQYIGQTFANITGVHEFVRINGFSELIVGVSGGFFHGSSTGNLIGASLPALAATATYPILIEPFIYYSGGGMTRGVNTVGDYTILRSAFSNNDQDYTNYLNQLYFTDGTAYVRYNGATNYLPFLPVAPIGSTIGGNMSASYLFTVSGGALLKGLVLGYAYHFFVETVNNNGEFGPMTHIGAVDLSATGSSLTTFLGASVAVVNATILTPSVYGISYVNMYVARGGGTLPSTYAIGDTAFALDIRFLDKSLVQSDPDFTQLGFFYNSSTLFDGFDRLPIALRGQYPYILPGVGVDTFNGAYYGQAVNFTQGYTLSPRFLEIYNDRLAMVGFSGLPSSFAITEVVSPASILPDDVFEVRTNDGDVLTGAKFFLNQLILFKQKSVHSFTGDAPENFYLKQVTSEYGCLNNKACCVWQDKLWFLDQSGIIEFNGANIQEVSTKVQPRFDQMNISAAINEAVMLHQKERNEIWCGIPINGATLNNFTIIYDYESNAWGYWDGFNPKYFANVRQRFNRTTGFYADYSGRINNFSPSYMGDNGAGISTVIQTRFEHSMGQSVEKMYRRLFINYDSLTGETVNNFNINYRKNYGESIVLTTGFTMTSFQQYNNFGIGAKSLSVEIGHYSAIEKLRIYGYTVEHRYQRAE